MLRRMVTMVLKPFTGCNLKNTLGFLIAVECLLSEDTGNSDSHTNIHDVCP